jgi:hypothetical protein
MGWSGRAPAAVRLRLANPLLAGFDVLTVLFDKGADGIFEQIEHGF